MHAHAQNVMVVCGAGGRGGGRANSHHVRVDSIITVYIDSGSYAHFTSSSQITRHRRTPVLHARNSGRGSRLEHVAMYPQTLEKKLESAGELCRGDDDVKGA